ncbi:hypothetical protein [Coprobacter tertius]|uniref:Portal protein n=1 Tax=Coprobacter tertius TaxID=2944915 RepID=A0ABT1MJ00_9BACT|nr:hypothetical protein [Coprobacter tertius]MCP9612595.1 hypothetical protein [Coprobacter tertius]
MKKKADRTLNRKLRITGGSKKEVKTDEVPKPDNRQYEILLQAKNTWESLDEYREKRMRGRDYTFGKQWNDKVTLPDGRTLTEEQYLKEQGKIPLKNNMIRQLVKNVVGQFRGTQTEPVCIARDREEQQLGELMSTAMQYAYQHNRLWELDGRTIEEFLISGSCFHKVGYGWRRDKMDVWVDEINPNRIFFNMMEDSRHWDCSLIGELHDVPVADVVSRFSGGSPRKAAWLRELYSHANETEICGCFENLTSERIDRLDFLVPSDPHLCRVIEVWRLESRERIKCHDRLKGEYFKAELSSLPGIEAENNRRKEAGLSGDDSTISIEWFIDRFWYYRFFTPFGDILDEGETPYWHGEHPYVFKLYPLVDGEIHSFVEDIIDQQRYINRLITMVDFIMGSSAKGVLLFPEDQIPDGMTIEDVAEEWTRYNGVILFKPRPGAPLPQQIAVNATNVGAYELLNLQMRLLDDISGVHGAMQGKTPSASTPASLYAMQTQNGSTNLVDLFESYKTFREDRDTKIMKVIQQYYTAERYRKIAGDSIEPENYSPGKVRNAEFDLTLAQSVSSPVYRLASNDFLLELFRMGQITLEMLLENGSFPFADKLLQSISKFKQEQKEQPVLPAKI